MTPHEIGQAVALLLATGRAVEVDYRYPRWPVSPVGFGPAWHDREETAALGHRAAFALRTSAPAAAPFGSPSVPRRPMIGRRGRPVPAHPAA